MLGLVFNHPSVITAVVYIVYDGDRVHGVYMVQLFKTAEATLAAKSQVSVPNYRSIVQWKSFFLLSNITPIPIFFTI